jgi:hypothetical protein
MRSLWSFVPSRLVVLFAAALLLPGPGALNPAPAFAQDTQNKDAQNASPNHTHRLLLKDGSYQIVSKYEVHGDRVRYMSAEREEWEELPYSLVDWSATEKYERDHPAVAAPDAAELDKEIAADRAREEEARPEVAPGLRLPDYSGVFLLDNFKGEPQLVEIQQSAGDVDRKTKVNIFRGAINPVAGQKQAIELDGSHASVQAHAEVPSLYLNVEGTPDQLASSEPQGPHIALDAPRTAPQSPQQPEQPEQPEQPQKASVPFDHYRIVRLDSKGNRRIVGDVKRAVTGKITEQEHFVKTTITQVKGGWLKITPTESLAPGEYALVEFMGKEGMNLYVWDFGVNPKAPANANPWMPEEKKPAEKP